MTDLATPPARPVVTLEEVRAVLAEHWGDLQPHTELGSQQDRNFLVGDGARRFVFKLANSATRADELDAQHAALRTLAEAGMRVPTPVPAQDGRDVVEVTIRGEHLLARLLTFVEGTPLLSFDGFGRAQARQLGDAAGRVVRALERFQHPGTERVSQWDVRAGLDVVEALLPSVPSPARREQIRTAVDWIGPRIAALQDDLVTQVIHADITDDNVVLGDDHSLGIIDFGDLMRSWRIGELVAIAASCYMRDDADVLLFEAIAGFTAHVALTDAELRALWPLTVLRTAVLVVSGEHQVRVDGDNDYADVRRASEWRAFASAVERDPDEMGVLVHAVASGSFTTAAVALGRLLEDPIDVVDLSVLSDEYDAGDWLAPGAHERILRRHAAPGRPAVSRWAEFQLTRTRPLAPRGAAPTCAIAVDVAVADDTTLTAPFDGVVAQVPGGFVLTGDALSLWVTEAASSSRAVELSSPGDAAGNASHRVARGERIATLRAEGLATVQLATVPGIRPPHSVRPLLVEHWRKVCPDPSALFGVDVAAPVISPERTLQRREAVFASAQEHYYRRPPQIERGWREFLIDTEAQTYVDVVNNVTIAGHAHPGIVEAAARQWALLNTNSRFHYAAVAELSERLAALAPAGLDRVFLVNSGSEAVDLALRLAQTATGRRRMLAAREAYHGWTIGADAVSTSLGDNPRALTTRPEWVELIDAPNPFRGTHRGPDAAAGYLADLDRRLAELGDGVGDIAGVIIEPIFGNGGGVLLPKGYLAGVYERVRALGGVCISDEVQVGYGRLGEYFWGFEEQDAVPDVIAIAKAMGNGQPLGAVITTAAIAEAFEQEGSFFSSAGGSPVSSRIGLAVLDALESEGLQENARIVGGAFADALRDLALQHPVIGAVHGMGLYLGVELVAPGSITPDPALAQRVCDLLLEEGCVVQPTGDHKNVLKIKPPMCISRETVDYVVVALDRCLQQAT